MKPTMENNQTYLPSQPEKRSSRKQLKIALSVVGMLLFAALAAFLTYLWQQNDIHSLEQDKTQLSSELAKSKTGTAEKVEPQDSDNTLYNAKVGKFSLTLPKNYVVIQLRDGGGEGGPATSLLLGESASEQGVVNSPQYDAVSISAHSIGGGSFREYVNGEISQDQPPQKLSSIKFDGVEAEVYQLSGLGAPKGVYFVKDDMFYKVYLQDTTDASNRKLEALAAGFKFSN